MRTKPAPEAVRIATELFGEHPEDVLTPLSSAADTLGWLEELFTTIKTEASAEPVNFRFKKLAELGEYVASDAANFCDSMHGTYIDRLLVAGAVSEDAKRR